MTRNQTLERLEDWHVSFMQAQQTLQVTPASPQAVGHKAAHVPIYSEHTKSVHFKHTSNCVEKDKSNENLLSSHLMHFK